MPEDYTKLEESKVYALYDMFKTKEQYLEAKPDLNGNEIVELENCKQNLLIIETYARSKRLEGVRWSLISLFKLKGFNPTLILNFYPGSDSYFKYGKTIAINVRFSKEDLEYILPNLKQEVPKVAGNLKFQLSPDFNDGELNTADIYSVQMI